MLDPFNLFDGWDTSTLGGKLGNLITAGPRMANKVAMSLEPYISPIAEASLGLPQGTISKGLQIADTIKRQHQDSHEFLASEDKDNWAKTMAAGVAGGLEMAQVPIGRPQTQENSLLRETTPMAPTPADMSTSRGKIASGIGAGLGVAQAVVPMIGASGKKGARIADGIQTGLNIAQGIMPMIKGGQGRGQGITNALGAVGSIVSAFAGPRNTYSSAFQNVGTLQGRRGGGLASLTKGFVPKNGGAGLQLRKMYL